MGLAGFMGIDGMCLQRYGTGMYPPPTKFIGEKETIVGGFNPFEKYWSKWESSPNRVNIKKYSI